MATGDPPVYSSTYPIAPYPSQQAFNMWQAYERKQKLAAMQRRIRRNKRNRN